MDLPAECFPLLEKARSVAYAASGPCKVDNRRDRVHAAYPGSLDISYLYNEKATTTITPTVILDSSVSIYHTTAR